MRKKLVRHRNIVSRKHVELDGPVRVSGYTVIGGNLTVNGDFECVGPLLCLGHVHVRGDLKCSDLLIAGCGVDVSGDLRVKYVKVWEGFFEDEDGVDAVASEILGCMPKAPKEDEESIFPREHLAEEDVVLDITSFIPTHALHVKGDCICGTIDAKGDIEVGGFFNPDDVWALGFSIDAERIVTEGDVVCGSLRAAREITVEGNMHCVEVVCMRLKVWGRAEAEELITVTAPDRRDDDTDPHRLEWEGTYDVEDGHDPLAKVALEQIRASLECGSVKAGSVSAAGSIRVEGGIECQGYLRANRSIIAGGSITTGKQHGILAGIGVPRDRWLATGYVCAPQKPPRILTGVYRALGRRRNSVLKPAALPRSTGSS